MVLTIVKMLVLHHTADCLTEEFWTQIMILNDAEKLSNCEKEDCTQEFNDFDALPMWLQHQVFENESLLLDGIYQ